MMFSVLVLEIEGNIIRSAVVKRTGWRKYAVSHCYEMNRWVEPEEPLKLEELAAFAAKIPSCPKNLVVVSARAMILQISLEKAEVKKAKFFKLTDLIRKESENYTGFGSDEIFLGFESQISEEKEEKTVSFQVAVCHKDYYLSLKEVSLDMNFKLKMLYPPEACFPVTGLYISKDISENDQTLHVDISSGSIKVCRLTEGRITAVRVMEALLKESADDLWPWEASEEDVGEFFDSLESSQDKVIISGEGAKRESVLEFIKEKLGVQIQTADVLLNGKNPEPAGCEYATAIGAGLRELKFLSAKGRQIGISDTVPFLKKIGDKLILIPLGMILLFFVFLVAHNWFITQETAEASSSLERLTNQRDNINRLIESVNESNAAIAESEVQQNDLRAKMHFLSDRITEYNSLLHITLAAMKDDAPQDIMFAHIQLLATDDQYFIQGESLSSTSIMNLALALQNPEWSLFAKVEEIIREEHRERIPENGREVALTEEIVMDETPEEIITDEVIIDEVPADDIFQDEFAQDLGAEGEVADEAQEEYRTVIVYRFRIRLVLDRSLVANLPVEWMVLQAAQAEQGVEERNETQEEVIIGEPEQNDEEQDQVQEEVILQEPEQNLEEEGEDK